MFFFKRPKRNIEKPLRAVLYTWTRTGASSLTTILSMHPDIRSIDEPFNPTQKHGQFVKDKNDRKFRQILENLWNDYNLIKHNHGLTKKQEKILLTESCNKVIFLWRKNSAKRVVSNELAKQTRIWGINTHSDSKEKLLNFDYNPIEIKKLLKNIENYLVSIKNIRDILQKNNVNYIEVAYEDMYEENYDSSIRIINKLFDFLDLDTNFPEYIREKIYLRLNPNNFKQNTISIYQKIPNIIEINTILSSKGYGPLF